MAVVVKSGILSTGTQIRIVNTAAVGVAPVYVVEMVQGHATMGEPIWSGVQMVTMADFIAILQLLGVIP